MLEPEHNDHSDEASDESSSTDSIKRIKILPGFNISETFYINSNHPLFEVSIYLK